MFFIRYAIGLMNKQSSMIFVIWFWPEVICMDKEATCCKGNLIANTIVTYGLAGLTWKIGLGFVAFV